MGKIFKVVKEKKRTIKFNPVSSNVGQAEWKIEFNKWTERFDLTKDGSLVLSDVCLSPCVGRAKEHGADLSEAKVEWQ